MKYLVDEMVRVGFAPCKSVARRYIYQGFVAIDGNEVKKQDAKIDSVHRVTLKDSSGNVLQSMIVDSREPVC